MLTLAIITGSGLVNLFVGLVIAGIILGLLLWLVGKAPMPEPFKAVATWVLYVVAVVVLINFLLAIIGKPFIVF